MTVAELIEQLKQYPAEMRVELEYGSSMYPDIYDPRNLKRETPQLAACDGILILNA